MTQQRANWIKGAILAALALMFAAKINTGTLTYYINQRFAWLALVAVILFAAFALTVVFRLIDRSAPNSPYGAAHGRLGLAGVALVALPAVIGLLVPARPLGAGALASRGVGLGAPVRAGAAAVAQRAGGPRTIIDWLMEIDRNPDPASLTGRTADVIGFVYHDPRLKADQFFVSRFSVSCCVADATPVALLVQVAGAGALKSDSWVRVSGRFAPGEFAGQALPVLVADAVDPADPPAQPYLFP